MYRNVLLVNGMIVNWKISSNTCWDTAIEKCLSDYYIPYTLNKEK